MVSAIRSDPTVMTTQPGVPATREEHEIKVIGKVLDVMEGAGGMDRSKRKSLTQRLGL